MKANPASEDLVTRIENTVSDASYATEFFDCPICEMKFRCRIRKNDLNDKKTPINTVLHLPCGHIYSIYLDTDGKIRNFSPLVKIDLHVEQIDVKYLENSYKKLRKIHDNIEDDNAKYEIFKKMKDVRKEISKIENDAEKPKEDDYIFI